MSSRENLPFVPAQTMAMFSPFSRATCATAEALRKEPSRSTRASFARRMARVPFVVVMTITRSATISGVYSSGELDR